MKSKRLGRDSSENVPEILNLGPRGMWLLVHQKEYFVDYSRYPWFQDATMAEIRLVELTGQGTGLYWPDLDIDVELEALEHPERYPLIAQFEAPKNKKRHHPQIPTKKRSRKAA